ncbi:MAG: site-specific DNA-methyltransferase [Bacteroidota bacterium]|nr:site-specific DNA-methyltransferase [Bacteroidota bacterium]
MDGKSLTPQELKLQQLKEILPEAFAEGKVDWEKLKATLGEDINFANERYVLNWAGKSEAFKILQTPTSKTLVPDKKESVNFNETENIFIEGENLEVLKVLQKSYFGKVKMIYIDPPYNTGNDSFIYPDKFSETKAEYAKRVGDKDEEGYLTKDGMFRKNSKENGQYHSNWLNMMYPRMFLAKNLLKQDGVIFISIDDNEVHNLRLIMNEVFGEENFVANVIWERAFSPINLKKHFSESHDYIICYAKNIEQLSCNGLIRNKAGIDRYKNPDNDIRGVWQSDNFSVGPVVVEKLYEIITPSGRKILPPSGRCWLLTKKRFEEYKQDNRIWFGESGNNVPRIKRFLSEVKQGVTPMTLWKHSEVGHSQQAAQSLKKLFDGKDFFDYPKPVGLIKRNLALYTNHNDFILDFFSGSATTAHAVMQLNTEDGGNRKCISVQMPELTDKKSEAYKAGYKNIADIAKERIRRAGKKTKEEITEKIKTKQQEIKELKSQLDLDGKEEKIKNLETEIEKLKNQDLGFKTLKLSDSNFKQWQQIKGKDAEALEKQMKLFVDPVAENATIENMVYELLLKSGKDLNSKLEHKDLPDLSVPQAGGKAGNYYCVNDNELIFMLEKATQEIVDAVIEENPQKVVALDRLFKDNDQLKTNTSLQMKDAGIEFKTI